MLTLRNSHNRSKKVICVLAFCSIEIVEQLIDLFRLPCVFSLKYRYSQKVCFENAAYASRLEDEALSALTDHGSPPRSIADGIQGPVDPTNHSTVSCGVDHDNVTLSKCQTNGIMEAWDQA